MAYQTIAERNVSEGLNILFVYVNDVTNGMMINMLLFALFMVTFLGSYFSSKRQQSGDLAVSFTIAGYFTAGAAFLFSIVFGVINILVVVIIVAISIVGTLWLYLSKSGD